MKSETFVTFEQAVKLKECGFDGRCQNYYTKENAADDDVLLITSGVANWNDDDECPFNKPLCSAPTLSLAQKWLRDEKGVDIDIRTKFIGHKRYDFVVINGTRQFFAKESYESYEAALSAGIDTALELIKQK